MGKLQWVASQTRPDLSFLSTSLAIDLANCQQDRINDINKTIRKARYRSDFCMKYPCMTGLDRLILFADSSFQNLPDGGSQGGYIIFATNQNLSPIHALSWSSKRIQRVVISTLGAETLALLEALDDALFLKELFLFILNRDLPIICVTDSKPLHSAIYSAKTVREKRLRVDISAIQQLISQKSVSEVLWVGSQSQLADSLTKKGNNGEFILETLRNNMLELPTLRPIPSAHV